MVKYTTAILAVALLAGSAAALAPRGYADDGSYIAAREHFETQFGRELTPIEAREIVEFVERNLAVKLAKKAAKKARLTAQHQAASSSGQEQRREYSDLAERNLAVKLAKKAAKKARLTAQSQAASSQEQRREYDVSVYGRELDFELLERGWVSDKWQKMKQNRKDKKAAKAAKKAEAAGADGLQARDFADDQSLYGREPDFGTWWHNLFHPHHAVATGTEDKKAATPAAAPSTDDAPAPSERSYDESMDILTREYYGFDDLD